MNSNYFTESVRKLRTDEKIPYDLLLLADETIEAIDKCIEDSEIYILEKQQKYLEFMSCSSLIKEVLKLNILLLMRNSKGKVLVRFYWKMPF